MKSALFAAAVALVATGAAAAPEKYTLDPAHSQVMFSYEHMGYSTTFNMLAGWDGEITFDAEDPAESLVDVSIPVMLLYTGWEKRFSHLMGPEFFGAQDGDMITFKSTAIKVTGDDTAVITGDLAINGITKSVQLDTTLNKEGQSAMTGKDHLGFDATTKIKRSDFGLGKFAPNVSDALDVTISIEASAAE